MSSCKDCVHYEACKNILTKAFPKTTEAEIEAVCNRECGCAIFKPKSRFVELPCEVGHIVWCVFSPPHPANPADKGKWFMKDFEVARFHYGVKGLSVEIYGYGTVSVGEIGKTVFIGDNAREEAEKALKERIEK